MWNLVVSKPEKHYLSSKFAIKKEFVSSRKKKHSFIADTKLQADQIKTKLEAKFNNPLFILKKYIFKSQNDNRLLSNKLDKIVWS